MRVVYIEMQKASSSSVHEREEEKVGATLEESWGLTPHLNEFKDTSACLL